MKGMYNPPHSSAELSGTSFERRIVEVLKGRAMASIHIAHALGWDPKDAIPMSNLRSALQRMKRWGWVVHDTAWKLTPLPVKGDAHG